MPLAGRCQLASTADRIPGLGQVLGALVKLLVGIFTTCIGTWIQVLALLLTQLPANADSGMQQVIWFRCLLLMGKTWVELLLAWSSPSCCGH